MRWPLAFAPVLLVAACTPPTPAARPPAPAPVCNARADTAGGLAEVGLPVEVRLGIEQFCITESSNAAPGRAADDAVVAVFDPDGDPCPFTASKPTRAGNSDGVSVSFTPTRAGQYRVTARLEPSIGITHRVVEVMAFSPGAASRLIDFEAARQCEQCAQTALGAVLCGACREQEVVTQAGQHIAASAVVLDGLTLWVARALEGRVERWLEQDAGVFVRTHQAGLADDGFPFLAAAGDGLWLFAGSAIQKLAPLPDGGLDGPSREVADFVVTGITSGNGIAYLFGSEGFLAIDGAGKTFQPLQSRARLPIATGEGAMWSRNLNDTDIEGVVLTPAGFKRATGAMRAGGSSGFLFNPAVPFIAQGFRDAGVALVAVPEIVEGTLVLTGYKSQEPGFSIVGATKQHIFLRSVDRKRIQVIDR